MAGPGGRLAGRLMSAGCLVVCGLLGFAPPGAAQGGSRPPPFSHNDVVGEAQALAAKPFVAPPQAPEGLRKLNFETYRQIRFRKERAIWGKAPSKFSIELLAPGFLYKQGIDIFVVENGKAHATRIDANAFDAPSDEIREMLVSLGKLAGFRLHYPLNRPDYKDEFILFQGASFFRALSRGQGYGLSARGLAIDVAEPNGEEFPVFRRFWIERPSSRTDNIVVHALLDSRRVAGAFRFGIYPGGTTAIDVKMTLFARQPLSHVGIGALTSMFYHGPIDGPDRPDYRPAVHDSVGLAMNTGRGERLWRPLNNPKQLQISAFVDENPKGFGLIQRERRFAHFQDIGAHYEARPSAWVVPAGDWGKGHVVLVEIPTRSETNDNIVAYWRPAQPIRPGEAYEMSYMLTWPNDVPPAGGISPVMRTAYAFPGRGSVHQLVLDYGPMPGVPLEGMTVETGIGPGKIVGAAVQANPETGGRRVVLSFDPGDGALSELRVQPRFKERPVGETMLYRWTRR